MHLEVQHPNQSVKETAILLVHGAFHGAWMWQDNFMPYFAERGFPTYAVDLRGRGKSELKRASRLHPMVEDLQMAIEQIGQPVVVIAHSMGGLITQKYLEQNQLKGAVLLCSIPPFGMHKSIRRLLVRTPSNFFKFIGMSAYFPSKKAGAPPTGIFPEELTEEEVKNISKQMNPESKRLLMRLMAQKVDIEAVRQTPLKILGAEDDGLIFKEDIIQTAEIYEQDYTLYQNMGHSIPFSPKAPKVADDILEWINKINH